MLCDNHDVTPSPSPTDQEATMPQSQFAHIQAGCLPTGTVTEFGVITRTSYTAYEMDNGEWVAFRRIHGTPAPVMPLVSLA
jgi:hypothetical protein